MNREKDHRPGVTRHVTINGKEYYVSPLTIGDMEELEKWAIDARMEKARDRIAQLGAHNLANDVAVQRVLEQAWADIDSGAAVSSALSTIEGTRKAVFLSLRKRSPDVTEELIKTAVTVPDMEAFQGKLDGANGLGRSGGPKARAGR